MGSHGGGCRLWIGNLDQYVTEYSLLKLFQHFSVKIIKFNIVYHRNGPDKGKSKGYCFLTVATEVDAHILIKGLDGKLVKGSKLHVKFAFPDDEVKNKSDDPKKSQINSAAQRNLQIKRIKDKLKSMEANDTSSSRGNEI